MRFFLFRFLLRSSRGRPHSAFKQAFHTTHKMAGPATSAILYATTVSGASVTGAVPEEAKDKKHHLKDGKGFTNPWDSYRHEPLMRLLPQIFARRFQSKQPDTTPPTVNVQTPKFLPTRATDKLRATWLGHACYLVEFPSGLRVLFDPVFSERCSPFSFMGPARYTKAPCQVDEIPTLDAVIISHNHYDHLDHPTLTRIRDRHPGAHFFVGLRNKQWFLDSGFPAERVTELDWWEQRELTVSAAPSTEKAPAAEAAPAAITATVSCLPCQHASARSLFDRNHTLWASWAVSSGAPGAAPASVFFGGDTAYRASLPPTGNPATTHDDHTADRPYPHCPAFTAIGAHRGPFDLGLIPIGAYKPRFLFSSVHADPFDSVEIFKDTRCKRAMGIHWGTWVLTEEDVLEPPRLLREALKASGIAEEGVFDTCEIGESREF